jgi:hypothetical protein
VLNIWRNSAPAIALFPSTAAGSANHRSPDFAIAAAAIAAAPGAKVTLSFFSACVFPRPQSLCCFATKTYWIADQIDDDGPRGIFVSRQHFHYLLTPSALLFDAHIICLFGN